MTDEERKELRELAEAATPADGSINRHMQVSVPLEDFIALLDEIERLKSGAPVRISTANLGTLGPVLVEIVREHGIIEAQREANRYLLESRDAMIRERDEAREQLAAMTAARDAIREETLNALLIWVSERWDAEVKDRPLQNVHRATLDSTWKQMLRKLEQMRSAP